jgi:hypothetical protein
VDLPAGFTPWNAVYKRSGALLVGATRAVGDDETNVAFKVSARGTYALLGNYTLAPGSGGSPLRNSIALAAKGSPLVYTLGDAKVRAFDIRRNEPAPVYAEIANASACTAAVPLFDGSALVGCRMGNGDVCAYRVRDCGTARKHKSPGHGRAGRVTARFCARNEALPEGIASGYLPQLALGVDRQHFFFTFINPGLLVTAPTIPNLYKLSVADFVPTANATIDAPLLRPAVYKAVPANVVSVAALCDAWGGLCVDARARARLA